MTTKQKIELRRSEVRSRLSEIAGLEGDTLTSDIGTERDGLMTELSASEPQLRACIAAEDGDSRLRGDQAGRDGESAELRALRGRVSIGNFLNEAASGNPLKENSPEAEFRAAVLPGVGMGYLPLRALADPNESEHRADAPTAIGAVEVPAIVSSWLDRVFVHSDSMFLGGEFESVEAGDTLFPVISNGVTGADGVAGVATDAEAATIAVKSLPPKELRVRYLFNRVDSVRLPMLEDALRRDLVGALGEAIDNRVIAALLTALTNPTAPPSDVASWVYLITSMMSAVDGRYASNLRDLAAVVGSATFQVASTAVGTNSLLDVASEYLQSRSRGFRVSVHIPAPATISSVTNIQSGIISRMGRGIIGSLKIPIWQQVELTRSPFGIEGAPSGRVALTATALYNVGVVRAENFKQVYFKTS